MARAGEWDRRAGRGYLRGRTRIAGGGREVAWPGLARETLSGGGAQGGGGGEVGRTRGGAGRGLGVAWRGGLAGLAFVRSGEGGGSRP